MKYILPAIVDPVGFIEWVATFNMLPFIVKTGCCEVNPFIINKSLDTVISLFEAILRKGRLCDWIKNMLAVLLLILTPTFPSRI